MIGLHKISLPKKHILLYGLPILFVGIISGSIATMTIKQSHADPIGGILQVNSNPPGAVVTNNNQPQPTSSSATDIHIIPNSSDTGSTTNAVVHADNTSPTSVPVVVTANPQTVNQVTNPGAVSNPCK